MVVFRVIFTILFVAVCIALTVIVLLQQGKGDGLSAIYGGNSSGGSYWEKNKSRSKAGRMALITKILCVAFMIMALLMNVLFQ